MKPNYSMSSVGGCSRALGASRLGYDPTPRSKDDLSRLQHYFRCETLAAQQITDLGYELYDGGYCSRCDRNGIHVEIDTPLFLLVGHIDRRITINGQKFPVEIKSLGKSSWIQFSRNRFATFPDYASQEACYLEAEGKPGIYWVIERDSGDVLKFIVNAHNREIDLEGFEGITLPVTFEQILDKLNLIEISVAEGKLPDGDVDDCFWCRYKFLCTKSEVKSGIMIKDSPKLIRAADNYKYALELEKQAEEMKSDARDVLLLHSKQEKIDKYQCNGLSITYRGQKVKTWLDESLIRKEAPPELVRLAERQSKPFDDYSIRRLAD